MQDAPRLFLGLLRQGKETFYCGEPPGAAEGQAPREPSGRV